VVLPFTNIGLISDIHANHISLKIALEQMQSLGVDKIYCAGDVVGYGGGPNEVINLLRKYKIPSILGNHDFLFLLELKIQQIEPDLPLVPDLQYLRSSLNFREIAVQMIEWQLERISPTNRKWLWSLPISLTDKENDLFLIHGAPPLSTRNGGRIRFNDYYYSTVQYLFPWDNEQLGISCQIQPQKTMIIGHSHMQFAHQATSIHYPPIKTAHPCLMKYNLFPISRELEPKIPLIINPGSTSQSRDEIHAPGFAILSFKGKKKRSVTWYRFLYPFDEYNEYLLKRNVPETILSSEFWKFDEELG
jgi:predicted phosphodiesterase